jgi:hypothetical protein
VVVHLDDYAVNEGLRQTGKAGPALTEQYPYLVVYWVNVRTDVGNEQLTGDGGLYVEIAGEQVSLRTAAREALKLAGEVEHVRREYLERAEREANAALRKRHGLPPGWPGLEPNP